MILIYLLLVASCLRLGFGGGVCCCWVLCVDCARLYVWLVLASCFGWCVVNDLVIWCWFWLVGFVCCLSAVIWCRCVRCLMLIWLAVNSVVYTL